MVFGSAYSTHPPHMQHFIKYCKQSHHYYPEVGIISSNYLLLATLIILTRALLASSRAYQQLSVLETRFIDTIFRSPDREFAYNGRNLDDNYIPGSSKHFVFL